MGDSWQSWAQRAVNQNVICHAHTVWRNAITQKIISVWARCSNSWEHVFSPRLLSILDEMLSYNRVCEFLLFPEALIITMALQSQLLWPDTWHGEWKFMARSAGDKNTPCLVYVISWLPWCRWRHLSEKLRNWSLKRWAKQKRQTSGKQTLGFFSCSLLIENS